jgi:hypothetical protein
MGKPTALAQLDSQRAAADYRVKLLTRQVEMLEAKEDAEPVISPKELELAIDADPRVQQILALIEDTQGKIAIYEQNAVNFQSHATYQDLQSKVNQYEEDLTKLRSDLEEEYRLALVKQAETQRREQLQKYKDELSIAKIAEESSTNNTCRNCKTPSRWAVSRWWILASRRPIWPSPKA